MFEVPKLGLKYLPKDIILKIAKLLDTAVDSGVEGPILTVWVCLSSRAHS
jgi:hypothetical protein